MTKTNRFIAKGFIAAVLLIGLTVGQVSASKSYPDVPTDHHAADSIQFLTDRGIIEGFPDNTFRPENAVTRAEASRIITGATFYLGIIYPAHNKRPMITFTDVKSHHWYSKPITHMYENRILNGFPDKSFRPNETVTRAQLTKMISDAFQLKDVQVKLPFTDVKPNAWYTPAITNLFATGIISQTNGQFKPSHKMSRAEVSQYVTNAMRYTMSLDDDRMDDSDEDIIPWDGTMP